MHAMKLGQTVMSYRKRKGMTIREFAEYSGISTSLISQIERGRANPSLQVLELIARALNVPLFTLFTKEIDPDTLISRKSERKKVYREDAAHSVYDVLTPDFLRSPVEVLMMDLKAKSVTTESHFSHSSKEELAIVIKGSIHVELEGKEYELGEGDVVRIPPNTRHRFLNRSDSPNLVLFILTPSIA